MNYDKKLLSKQAQELGFVRDTFEKMLRLATILKHISGDPKLSSSLVLKGGTAINLTIFDLPRLSVDIDLDYTINNSKEEMMKERAEITAILERYMAAGQYELSKKSKSTHSLDSFVYVYLNSGGMKDNIKIEINYSLRSHILPFESKPIETIGIFSKTNVLSVAPIEIFGSKIVALLTRTKARDLYDIYNMITYNLFNNTETELLRKCAIFYYTIASDDESYSFDINRIYSLTKHKIRTDLQPVLRKKVRFELVTAQRCVDEYLAKLLVLDEEEKKYLDAFKNNIYKPELLFKDSKILTRLSNHPMALWKANQKT